MSKTPFTNPLCNASQVALGERDDGMMGADRGYTVVEGEQKRLFSMAKNWLASERERERKRERERANGRYSLIQVEGGLVE
jgi:hypothetical protein